MLEGNNQHFNILEHKLMDMCKNKINTPDEENEVYKLID